MVVDPGLESVGFLIEGTMVWRIVKVDTSFHSVTTSQNASTGKRLTSLLLLVALGFSIWLAVLFTDPPSSDFRSSTHHHVREYGLKAPKRHRDVAHLLSTKRLSTYNAPSLLVPI